MNTPPNDAPELTAYALGELSADQARGVHAMLASQPAALSELEQVEAVTDALRQNAPIPQARLTPEQRHSVLHPTSIPRYPAPRLPVRKEMARRAPAFWPVVRGFAQAAAIVAVAGVAFVAGRNVSLRTASATSSVPAADAGVTQPAPQAPIADAAAPPRPVGSTLASVPLEIAPLPPAPILQVPKSRPEVVVIPAAPVPAPAPQPPNAVATAAKTPPAAPIVAAQLAQKPASQVKTTKPAADRAVAWARFTTPAASDTFVNAGRRASDEFSLHPAKIRPLPSKNNAAGLFASPPVKQPSADAKAAKTKPAELYIHSWRADVVTCPWNEANRLMRVTIQLPADQPAAQSPEGAYPFQVTFDPNAVREYRMLCERHQPAAELRSAGTVVLWYEYLPNGSPDARENGRQVAVVTLPGARFTTQALEPFDGSKLRIIDRGQAWESARDDFLYESSVVGFGMLLRGTAQTGRLNHQLVLDLAAKAKGPDATGERAQFIRHVQEAKNAAGL